MELDQLAEAALRAVEDAERVPVAKAASDAESPRGRRICVKTVIRDDRGRISHVVEQWTDGDEVALPPVVKYNARDGARRKYGDTGSYGDRGGATGPTMTPEELEDALGRRPTKLDVERVAKSVPLSEAELAALRKYAEDQPRDESGRWSAEAQAAVAAAKARGYWGADETPREEPGHGLTVGLVHPSGHALTVNRYGEWSHIDSNGDVRARGKDAKSLGRRLARVHGGKP